MNIDVKLREKLLGLTVEQAKKEMDGYIIRVRKEDGVAYMGTADVKLNRINVEVNNKLIVEVYGIG